MPSSREPHDRRTESTAPRARNTSLPLDTDADGAELTLRELQTPPSPEMRPSLPSKTPQALRRRRFLRSFRERARKRQQRRGVQPRVRVSVPKAGRRKRKRAAVALGVGAMGLTGASNLAISAELLAAQGITSMSNAGQSPYDLFDPTERRSAERLKASTDLVEAMIEEEGVRYDVYRDVAGYPTVGVGHLIDPNDGLRLGDTISHDEALEFLENDLAEAQEGARDLVGDLPVNQHEFDALVDLVYNVGAGTVSEDESPRLNAAIDRGDYQKLADELEYTTAGSKVAPGLIHRSERRSQIFMNGDYSDPRES